MLFRKKPHKIIMVYEYQMWQKIFFIQIEKKHKITMAHGCQIWYLVTRLYI